METGKVGTEKIVRQMDYEEDTIDLLDLAGVLFRKLWIILLALLVGAVGTGLGTVLFVTPQYQATSMIYVYSKTTSITSLADLQIGSQLAVDFQIVATTREVMDNVIEELQLDTTYEDLLETVEITNPDNSHILQIDVTNQDPTLAADISNAIANELRARIAEVMNTDEPSMVQRAYVPEEPSSPSLLKNVAIGGFAAAAVVVAAIVVAYLLDDTIKTGEDVQKYLGLNVLAEIPVERSQKKKQAG